MLINISLMGITVQVSGVCSMLVSLVKDISTAWKVMEGAEKEYEEFLRNEITRYAVNIVCIILTGLLSVRLERLEHLAARFNHKASNLEAWMAGKTEQLAQRDDVESASLAEALASCLFVSDGNTMLYHLQALLKIHETFDTDLEAHKSRIGLLTDIARELK